MANDPDKNGSIIWIGKPWILPAFIARLLLVIGVIIVLLWFEFYVNIEGYALLGISIAYWTIIILFAVWLMSIIGLLIMRATNNYTLRKESLEIKTGILTSRSFVVIPSGFSDLEVTRGVAGRIFGYGDITIYTQSERTSQKVMINVKDPLKVGNKIRQVMSTQTVRISDSAIS
jgi:membrane protein YdbS with pleckstrin-like domain